MNIDFFYKFLLQFAIFCHQFQSCPAFPKCIMHHVYEAYSPGARRLVTKTYYFFNDFLVRRPVKSWSRWGAVWIFFSASGKYKFIRRLAKRAETANYFSANQN